MTQPTHYDYEPNFFKRNKGKIFFFAGFFSMFTLHILIVRGWNEFLKEKGIYDEYYMPYE